MARHISAHVATVLVFGLTLAAFCLPSNSRADLAADAYAAAVRADSSLAERIRLGKIDASRLPRLSAAADAVELKALWNVEAIIAARPATKDDITKLMDWAGRSSACFKAYLLAGAAATEQDLERNVETFGAELSLGALFNMRITASSVQSAMDFFAKLPEAEQQNPYRKSGFEQMMTGFTQQVLGMLAMELSGKPLAPGTAGRASAALLADVSLVSPQLSADQKKQIADTISTIKRDILDAQTNGDLDNLRSVLQK